VHKPQPVFLGQLATCSICQQYLKVAMAHELPTGDRVEYVCLACAGQIFRWAYQGAVLDEPVEQLDTLFRSAAVQLPLEFPKD